MHGIFIMDISVKWIDLSLIRYIIHYLIIFMNDEYLPDQFFLLFSFVLISKNQKTPKKFFLLWLMMKLTVNAIDSSWCDQIRQSNQKLTIKFNRCNRKNNVDTFRLNIDDKSLISRHTVCASSFSLKAKEYLKKISTIYS